MLKENSYVGQIQRVQDYIENHLEECLSLKQLSEIAFFSEFYFSRLFKLVSGEPIYSFIKRLRLEKAAFRLLAARDELITDIAISVGFENSSSFAKAFKTAYGISASDYRESKNGQAILEAFIYNRDIDFYEYYQTLIQLEPIGIAVKELPQKHLIYKRYTGPYKGDKDLFSSLFTELYQWANIHEVYDTKYQWFTLYHDFGSVTEEEALRVSVCMEIDEPIEVVDTIGNYQLEKGLYVVGRFEVTTEGYQTAWDYMYLHWLPSSVYVHDDRFSFETYPPVKSSQKGARVVDICIPVRCKNREV